MSINVEQLRLHVVRPTLNYLDPAIPYSRAAENLVIGTALTESRGQYLKQLGVGPALGLWQMEPFTHDDIWNNWLRHKPTILSRVTDLETPARITKGALELIGNLYYAAAMCRVFYRRTPDAIPAEHDALAMSVLWKNRYNTHLGAGSVAKALPYFKEACDGQ